jgi:hypothetical protein
MKLPTVEANLAAFLTIVYGTIDARRCRGGRGDRHKVWTADQATLGKGGSDRA